MKLNVSEGFVQGVSLVPEDLLESNVSVFPIDVVQASSRQPDTRIIIISFKKKSKFNQKIEKLMRNNTNLNCLKKLLSLANESLFFWDMVNCSNCDCSKNLLDTILLLLDTIRAIIFFLVVCSNPVNLWELT